MPEETVKYTLVHLARTLAFWGYEIRGYRLKGLDCRRVYESLNALPVALFTRLPEYGEN